MPPDPAQLQSLEAHLNERIGILSGPWVARPSGYEQDLATLIGAEVDTGRYWDATWDGQRLEFKKGRSIWLDLIRYSEQLLGDAPDAREPVVTLFFIPDDEREAIVEIQALTTGAIIALLGLRENDAHDLAALRERVPRSLNAQASLTVKDIRSASAFGIA